MTTTEQIHQKDLQRLQSLRYMDDDFMTVCISYMLMENIGAMMKLES